MALTNKAASSSWLDVTLWALTILLVEQEFQVRGDGARWRPARRRSIAAPSSWSACSRASEPVALGELAAASGHPEEHRVAAAERARTPRIGRAGRPAGPAAARAGDPARRRARHAGAQRGRAGAALARRARRSHAARRSTWRCRPATASSTSPQVESRHFLGAGQWLGRSVDYHCTANGKVFLAFGRAPMPAPPLRRYTPATVTDPGRCAPSSRPSAARALPPPSTSSRPGWPRSPRPSAAPAATWSRRSASPARRCG